ncbi:HNH endonuclease [Haloferax sp. Atlit-6N]|uniref:HNH endonuclease n=1 Tax=unclassified Haloferax TaxID=2625095 RepID=UPI000E273338|nr:MULTISPECIES: HNH endonuclease [unclassified Haloferax]RDZ55108.1 HNH endonuclease [Haloferax sp. Atlit-4N]REA05250.1 HNH endonuclease [Haloferax sp. Atlit-6N]
MSEDAETTTGRTTRRRRTIDRERIFRRDDYTCQNCGREYDEGSHILEVAHQRPARDFENPDDADAPENLVTLCPNCHRRFDMGELGDRIASSLQRDFRERAKARNHASTVEAFAGDAIEITKLNVLIASVFGTGVTVLLQADVVTDVSALVNFGVGFGGLAWVLSTGFTLLAYHSCRTSGASSSAIEEVLEGGDDDELPEETTKIYYRNARRIGIAIGLTLSCVLLLIAGIALAATGDGGLAALVE